MVATPATARVAWIGALLGGPAAPLPILPPANAPGRQQIINKSHKPITYVGFKMDFLAPDLSWPNPDH